MEMFWIFFGERSTAHNERKSRSEQKLSWSHCFLFLSLQWLTLWRPWKNLFNVCWKEVKQQPQVIYALARSECRIVMLNVVHVWLRDWMIPTTIEWYCRALMLYRRCYEGQGKRSWSDRVLAVMEECCLVLKELALGVLRWSCSRSTYDMSDNMIGCAYND